MSRLLYYAILMAILVSCTPKQENPPVGKRNYVLNQNIVLFKNDLQGRPLSIAAQDSIINEVNRVKPAGRADIKIIKRCPCDSSLVLLEGNDLHNIRIRDGGDVASNTNPRSGVSGAGSLSAIQSRGDSIIIPQLLSGGTRNLFTTLPLPPDRRRAALKNENGRRLVDLPASKKAGKFIIGIIDTGFNTGWCTSPDIASRLWRNPAEQAGSANKDDDKDGFTDDLVGWDFVANTNNPVDDLFHGTLVTQLIDEQVLARKGASDGVRYMILKTHDGQGQSTLFNNLCALSYARKKGARIINASWGFYDQNESPLLTYYLRELRDHNVLLVAAAGNTESDADNQAVAAGLPATALRNISRHKFWPASADTITNVLTVTTIAGRPGQDKVPGVVTRVCPDQNWSAPQVDVGVANADLRCDIVNMLNGAGRRSETGSSYAAPVVTGKLAAYLWPNWPNSHEQLVLDKLRDIDAQLLLRSPVLRGFIRKEQYVSRKP